MVGLGKCPGQVSRALGRAEYLGAGRTCLGDNTETGTGDFACGLGYAMNTFEDEWDHEKLQPMLITQTQNCLLLGLGLRSHSIFRTVHPPQWQPPKLLLPNADIGRAYFNPR